MRIILITLLFFVSTQFVFSQFSDPILKYKEYKESGEIMDIEILGNQKYLNISGVGIFLINGNNITDTLGTDIRNIYHINTDNNNIWCVKERGEVFKLNNLIPYEFSRNEYFLNDITFDNNDNILFPDPSELGFIKFNKNTNSYSSFTYKGEKSPLVKCIYVDSKDKIWLGTRNGLYFYNEEDKKFEKEMSRHAPKNRVYQIVGNDSVMFVGGESRVWKYRHKNEEWKILLNNYGAKTKSNVQRNSLKKTGGIKDMTLDHKGNLWIASSKIIRYDVRGYWEIFDFFDDNNQKIKEGIKPTSIRTEKLTNDSTKIWIGTEQKGLWHLKTRTITTTTGLKNIVFIIDPSLKKWRLRKIKKIIKSWTYFLNPDDKISIISYSYNEEGVSGYRNILNEGEPTLTAKDSRKILRQIGKVKRKKVAINREINLDTIYKKKRVNDDYIKRPDFFTEIKDYEILKHTFSDTLINDTLKTIITNTENLTYKNAYLIACKVAVDNEIKGGNNRIIVFTDRTPYSLVAELKAILKETYDKKLISIDFIIF